MKKLLALFLAALMLLGIASAAVAESPTRLVMMFMTWTGPPADTQMVVDAINEITIPELGIEVDVQIADIGSYAQAVQLALVGGEQIDMVSTTPQTYPTFVAQGYLLDLEENGLLDTYGTGIKEAMSEEFIDACRVGGVLYGLPNNRDMASGRGCAAVATEYLEGIGYEVPKDQEIVRITLDELNEIFAKLHETYPDIEVYRPVSFTMQQSSNADLLGGTEFGVLMDYGSSLDVVNLFETDFYREYCERIYDYNQKGYIGPDAATDTTAVTELVKAGALMTYTTGGKPGIKQQETNMCGRDMTIFQTYDNFISSSAIASFPWAIPINTVDAEKAMILMNAFYSDPRLMNLISWGIEGVHYRILENGLIDHPEGVDAMNATYSHSINWLLPNQFITHVWNGNDPDVWKQIAEFNATAQKSMASGFTFDSTEIATEFTAVQNVYNEYQKSLEYGFVDPAIGIPEMNEKLMSAGLQAIIDAKQEQLNAWAEANQ